MPLSCGREPRPARLGRPRHHSQGKFREKQGAIALRKAWFRAGTLTTLPPAFLDSLLRYA